MKKTLIIMLLLILPVVIALESTKVYIIDLSYKDGKLAINDKVIKYGYSPDRLLQPLEGYKAEIVSVNDDVLYSFKFEIPLKEYTDVGDNITKQISGGIIKLSETDFALVLPYYNNAEKIVFYDIDESKVASVDVKEKKKAEKELKQGFFGILFMIVLIILFWILLRTRKKRAKK